MNKNVLIKYFITLNFKDVGIDKTNQTSFQKSFSDLSIGLHAQEKVIYILHTNNTNGALENCYCPDKPYGAVENVLFLLKNSCKKTLIRY